MSNIIQNTWVYNVNSIGSIKKTDEFNEEITYESYSDPRFRIKFFLDGSYSSSLSIFKNMITVNTVKYSTFINPEKAILIQKEEHKSSPFTLVFHINDKCSYNFEGTFEVYEILKYDYTEEGEIKTKTIDEKILSKTIKYSTDLINAYDSAIKKSAVMNMPDTSYALLRTNPKLTGNVKVVVDSSNNMFLDTFKISKALSQNKYRHISINPDNYYGQTLCSKFKDMPISDFYKVEDKCYALFTPAQKLNEQYYDTYNYGVRTNNDKMYSENFALLAPLCIKTTLPDFFLIFKIDKSSINENNISDNEKLNYFINNGELIKSYDLRENSPIGKYIRNIQEFALGKPGYGYISYDLENYNQFIGISLDKGVVTNIYESPYLEKDFSNQVAMNSFYTSRFEKNHLVAKDIINFEFLFNDKNEETFSINTYFGLYVKVNTETSDFACIDVIDSKNVFDSSIHTFNNVVSIKNSKYSNIIYGITTPNEFKRLDEGLYDSSIVSEYKLKPYKSLLNVPVKELSLNGIKTFMTINLNDYLEVGEHLRIISPSKKVIYDVILSNGIKYLDNNFLTDICVNGYKYGSSNYTIHTISVNVPYLKDAKDEISLGEETSRIFYAFNKLENNIFNAHRLDKSSNLITFIGYVDDLIFERICADSGFTEQQQDYINTTHSEDNKLTFFGNITGTKCILNVTSNWESFVNSYLYPIHTEVCGDRMCYALDFLNTSTFANDVIYSGIFNNTEIFKNTLVYKTLESNYVKYVPFEIYKYVNDGYKIKKECITTHWVQSYNDIDYKILSIKKPSLSNNIVSLYKAYLLNAGICSIFNFKDFYYDVLDSSSIIGNYKEPFKIGNPGEFSESVPKIKLNNEEVISSYFSLNYNDIITDVSTNNNYFKNKLINENILSSGVSLLSPYVCKWSGLGTDNRGKCLRVMHDYDSLQKYFSFFNSDVNIFDTSVGYNQTTGFADDVKTFKNSINKLCVSNNALSQRFKDKLFESENVSIDNLIYTPNNSDNKFSPVYIIKNNDTETTIEFISAGVKINIHTANNNIIDLSKYKNYNAVLATTSDTNCTHPNNVDILIDENTSEIIVIWYLNENYKESLTAIPFNHKLEDLEYYVVNNVNDSKTVYLGLDYDEKIIEFSQNSILVLESYADTDSYTKMPDIVITGKCIYSANEKYLSIKDPIVWVDENTSINVDETIFEKYFSYYNNKVYAYISEGSVKYDNSYNNLSTLKNTDIKNVSLYVKSKTTKLDYTNLENIISVSVGDIITKNNYASKVQKDYGNSTKYYVHSSYIEPILKDVFLYSNTVDHFESIFDYNFNNSNILISGIISLNQLWHKKYTKLSNYCIDNSSINTAVRLGINVLHDMSIIHNSWSNDLYKEYSIENNKEVISSIAGYQSGYELTTFFDSKGINLNGSDGNSIILTSWTKAEIIDNKCIKLNISDSIINYILFKDSYAAVWNYLNINTNAYKINYIKNTILPLININNKTKFTLYKYKQIIHNLSFDPILDEERFTEVSNIKNELKYENGKYYMYVYPEDLTTYSAKMIIGL